MSKTTIRNKARHPTGPQKKLPGSSQPKIPLDRSMILVDESQLSYVQYGAREVAEYLKEITGNEIPIKSLPDPEAEIQIVVGTKSVQQVAPDVWRDQADKLGTEGFLIRVLADGNQRRVIVTGATPQGTKYGIVNLIKRIQVAGRSAFVPATLNITSKPSFSVRGMHLNGWAFNYPYTFRCWKEDDWKRYIDILTFQGCNLFYLWPFMEIMPVPLSAEDASYLKEMRRVVDYAQCQRGLEVWIMQSANRVALNDCGVRDPRMRPYWVMKVQGDFAAAGQADMDPGDPKQFEAIMKSREALYRIVNNADGYGTIDSDPGGWAKSPLSDLMKIFRVSRGLLDRICVHGKRVKQIHWLWCGWGQSLDWLNKGNQQEQHDFMRETIRAMKREVPEPWWLIAGMKKYLPACTDERVLAKTVYLPYGAIEAEPSRPATQNNFPRVRDNLDTLVRHTGIAGVMGNVQTPLLQFPHVYYFLSSAWDYERRQREPREVMLELAEHLYPEQAKLLTDAWMALEASGRSRIKEWVDKLDRLVTDKRMRRSGVLGRKLFPQNLQIARDLAWQLKGWAAFEALRQSLTPSTPKATCAKLVEAFLDTVLAWDRQHGWSAYWHRLGTAQNLLPSMDPGFPQVLANLKNVLGGAVDEATVKAFLAPIGKRLMRKYDPWVVARCAIEPLKEAVTKTQ